MFKKTRIDAVDKDFYTVKGVIAESKTSKDGEELEPVRKFFYQGNKVALNISLMVPTTVQKRSIQVPVDLVCFDTNQFDGILELNLRSGDKVEIFSRKTDKGLAIDDCNWVTPQKSI